MKTKSKALILSVCAVLLVAATVLVTMAFLTSTDSVNNTFTVGKVAITLDEAKVDVMGVVDTTATSRVKANTYKLIPGHMYVKDPTVHVDATSEDSWLFVKLENGLVNIIDNTTIEAQMAANGWTAVSGKTGVYAYRSIVSAGDNVKVFGSFTLKGDADVASYANAKISVTAYAIQADGFATSADAAAQLTF